MVALYQSTLFVRSEELKKKKKQIVSLVKFFMARYIFTIRYSIQHFMHE